MIGISAATAVSYTLEDCGPGAIKEGLDSERVHFFVFEEVDVEGRVGASYWTGVAAFGVAGRREW